MKRLAFILFLILGVVTISADTTSDITDLMQRAATTKHVVVRKITSQNAISFEVKRYDPASGGDAESIWTKVMLADINAELAAAEEKVMELQAIKAYVLKQLGLPPVDAKLLPIKSIEYNEPKEVLEIGDLGMGKPWEDMGILIHHGDGFGYIEVTPFYYMPTFRFEDADLAVMGVE